MSQALLKSSRCSVIHECVMQIYISLSTMCYCHLSRTVWQRIVGNVGPVLDGSSGLIGYCLCQQKAAELLIGLILMSDRYADMCIPVIDKLLKHSTYEVIHVVLDIIFVIICENNNSTESNDKLFPLIAMLSVVKKCEVKNIILNSDSTATFIAQYLIKCEHPDDLYKGMSVASNFPLALKVLSREHNNIVMFLVLLCNEQEEKVISAVICCIGAYLSLQVMYY